LREATPSATAGGCQRPRNDHPPHWSLEARRTTKTADGIDGLVNRGERFKFPCQMRSNSITIALHSRAEDSEAEAEGHETLLVAVVQIPLEAPARRVARLVDALSCSTFARSSASSRSFSSASAATAPAARICSASSSNAGSWTIAAIAGTAVLSFSRASCSIGEGAVRARAATVSGRGIAQPPLHFVQCTSATGSPAISLVTQSTSSSPLTFNL
jgi:hypothetical protein